MAEEFQQLPISLQNISRTLVHHRTSRTAFICGVIVLMSAGSLMSLILSPSELYIRDQATTADSNSSTTSKTVTSPMYIQSDAPMSTNDSSELNLESTSQEIILNLILTANIQHNVTINREKMDEERCLETCVRNNCSESCIKYFIDVIGWENILKFANQTELNANRENGVPKTINNFNINNFIENLNGSDGNLVINNNIFINNLPENRNQTLNMSNNIPVNLRKKRSLSSGNFTNLTFVKSILSDSQISKIVSDAATVLDDVQVKSSELEDIAPADITTNVDAIYYYCIHSEYFVFCWVLCLIALATALKLYYMIKTFLALLMVGIYTILIMVPFKHIFSDMEYRDPEQ